MSTRTKTAVDNWSDGQVRLIIQFGDDHRFQVPILARNRNLFASPVPTLESKFNLTTQLFTIPRLNGGWAGTIRKPRLNIAAIWGWISQIQSPRK